MKRLLFLVAVLAIATFSISAVCEGCAQPRTVDAKTGEIVKESNTLNGKSFRVPQAPVSSKLGVMEYSRGGMTYLVMETSQGISVVNYTLDSIELSYHDDEPGPLPKEEIPNTSTTGVIGVWR